MKAMLTSSLGGSVRENGKRVPALLVQSNHLLENLKSMWPENARVLIVCADPADYEKNDSVRACLREALPMSALSVSRVDMCDDRIRTGIWKMWMWLSCRADMCRHRTAF